MFKPEASLPKPEKKKRLSFKEQEAAELKEGLSLLRKDSAKRAARVKEPAKEEPKVTAPDVGAYLGETIPERAEDLQEAVEESILLPELGDLLDQAGAAPVARKKQEDAAALAEVRQRLKPPESPVEKRKPIEKVNPVKLKAKLKKYFELEKGLMGPEIAERFASFAKDEAQEYVEDLKKMRDGIMDDDDILSMALTNRLQLKEAEINTLDDYDFARTRELFKDIYTEAVIIAERMLEEKK